MPEERLARRDCRKTEMQMPWQGGAKGMRYTVQLRDRGTLTLPSAVRERYHYDAGDVFTLVDLEGTIVLVPKAPVVPKLAAEIEKMRETGGLSVEELLHDARDQRHAEAPR